MLVLPGPYRRMEERKNSAETKYTSPEIKNGRIVSKTARRRGSDELALRIAYISLLRSLLSNKKKIKSSIYSLNTLSSVTSERCPSPRLCAKAHTMKVATVASRWQRVVDLIGSGFEPHTSRTRIFKNRLSNVDLFPNSIRHHFFYRCDFQNNCTPE